MTQETPAQEVLDALRSSDSQVASDARMKLRNAPPTVTDGLATLLASELAGGASASTCRVIEELGYPMFGDASWSELKQALRQCPGRAAKDALANFGYLKDDEYQRKVQDAAIRSTGLLRRIASVFGRAWVIVVSAMPALFAIVTIVDDSSTAPAVLGMLAAFATLVVLIDAYKRRCPRCRKWLAGWLGQITQDGSYAARARGGGEYQVNTHKRSWRCVHCDRSWET